MSACMPTTVRSACFSSSARICRSTSSFRRLFSSVLSSVASRSASRWSATSRSPARLAIASVRERSGPCACNTAGINAKDAMDAKKKRKIGSLCDLRESCVWLKEWLSIYIGRYRQPEVLQYGWRDVHDLQAAGGDRTVGNQDAGRLLVIVRAV